MKKSIYLNKDTQRKLEELSKTYGRPKGELINLFIKMALNEIYHDVPQEDFRKDLNNAKTK